MPNTSATGGYLTPSSAPPAEDAVLDRQLQQMVVGITGLTGSLVRPRWQVKPPSQPEIETDWCAIGVIDEDNDDNAAIVHISAANGSDEMQRHEVITVLASFYGPNCRGNAKLLRDGIQLPQNREVIRFQQGLAFIDTDKVRNVPELVFQQWLGRADLQMRFRRQVTRTYAVNNVLGITGTIKADTPPTNPVSDPLKV